MGTRTRIPERLSASGSNLGWFGLYVTATNNIDGTTGLLCELVHTPGDYTTNTATVSGSIAVQVGSVTKTLAVPSTISATRNGSDYVRYSETLTFARLSETENATITVTSFKASATVNVGNGKWSTLSAIWGDAGYDGTLTYTLALDSIALQSSWSLLPESIETLDTLTGMVNSVNSTYKHKATISYGSEVLWESELFESNMSHTVPRDWMNRDTSAEEIDVTVALKTYSGDTQVGPTVTRTVTVRADANMKPNVPAAALSIASSYAVSGIPANVYIQTVGKVAVTVDVSKIDLSRCAGATASDRYVAISGKKYRDVSFTSNALSTSGSVKVTLKVIDSRGRSGSTSVTISVQTYSAPTLGVNRVWRSDADGIEDDSKQYLTANITAAACGLTVDNPLTVNAVIGGTSYALNTSGATTFGGNAINPDVGVTVTFSAKDRFGTTTTVTRSIPTRVWAMQFTATGNGVAFGKAAEHSKTLQIPADWSFRIGDTTITGAQLAALLEMIT